MIVVTASMGCTSCSKSGVCGNATTYLGNYKKLATTLFNTSRDELEREELMSLIFDINELITNSKNICPSQEELNLIKEYISSEYSKRIRQG
jgi:hypothetical protein